MYTVLYNVGLFSILIGAFLYVLKIKRRGEVEVEGLGKIKGNEGFVLIALGILLMAAASWV